jgi:hypothetical protein
MNENHNLKPLLYSSLLFVSLFFIGDRIIGYYLNNLYFKQKKGDFFETTYALKNVKEDLLIFGSSRAVRHYDPKILQDSLNLSAINVGKIGNTLLYSYAAFSQILTYHVPKVIVLDISPIEFAKSERERGQKSMIDVLLKYQDMPVIEQQIKQLDTKELLLSKLFWTYKFNSSMFTLLTNDQGSGKLSQSKGFKSRKGTKITENYVTVDNNDYVEDTILVNTFHNFLTKARNNKIEVHVVISPTTLYQTHNSVTRIKEITEEFGYHLLDISHRPQFKQAALYYDMTHLNNVGAKNFSVLLGDSLHQVNVKESIAYD